jgi:hypothetical protein
MALEPVTYLPPAMPGIHATYKHQLPGSVADARGPHRRLGRRRGGRRHLQARCASPAQSHRRLRASRRSIGRAAAPTSSCCTSGPTATSTAPASCPSTCSATIARRASMVNLGRCSVSMGEAYTMGNFSDGTIDHRVLPAIARLASTTRKSPTASAPMSPPIRATSAGSTRSASAPSGMAIVPQLTRRPTARSCPSAPVDRLPARLRHSGAAPSPGWIPKPGRTPAIAPRAGLLAVLPALAARVEIAARRPQHRERHRHPDQAKNGAFVLWDPIEDRARLRRGLRLEDLGQHPGPRAGRPRPGSMPSSANPVSPPIPWARKKPGRGSP